MRLRNRGLVHWTGTEGERIFHFVRDRVYAVDAKSGALISTFGQAGFIDLRQDLGVDPSSAVIEMTSPGAVFKNFLIVASRVNESYDASPGHIRAYDTVSGALKWTFHTIPREGQVGHDSWKWVKGESYGGANAWGGVTIDETRGWVFAATGSATEDFYGGFRKGDNLFANSVLALDATTGERKWHYQTVRHDIWDYDNPPAPILVTLGSGPTAKDAVVQLTKMGFTFVLDRDTGQPLFPVRTFRCHVRRCLARRQHHPARTAEASAARQADADRGRSHEHHAGGARTCAERIPPLSVRADLHAAEPRGHDHNARAPWRRRVAWRQLRSRAQHAVRQRQRGADHQPAASSVRAPRFWRTIAHRTRAGNLRPRLHGLPWRRSTRDASPYAASRRPQAHTSRNRDRDRAGTQCDAAFTQLRPSEISALSAFLKTPPGDVTGQRPSRRFPIATRSTAIPCFWTRTVCRPSRHPGGRSMRSTLSKGRFPGRCRWGYPQLIAKGIRNTGTLNFGGAVATAGGVIFVAATADEKIRAFEKTRDACCGSINCPRAAMRHPACT